MDLRSGLRLLREQWKLILVVTILATATGGFVTWRETPQYTSQVTMFVSTWGSPDDTAAAYQGSLLSQQKVKSYIELLRGYEVMSGVADRLDQELTAEQLSGKVSTAAIPDTALLTATVQDPSPERAQEIAEALGEEFVAFVPEVERVARGDRPAVTVTVVDPAELPTAPVSPKPVRNLALAAVLGLLIGYALALSRRTLDTTVKSADQAAEISGVPSLGTIAFDGKAGKRPLIDVGWYGPRAEAYRKVRTNLQFVEVDKAHQTILVTSAVPGEGKSVTACNLALVLAEAEKRVIVVDADLRRPSIAGYLGLPGGVGLTSVLLGDATLADAVQLWGGQMFATLASGPIPPNPNTLLASQRLRNLLDELRSLYDVVIVDSPPVTPVADATVLAAACDGAMVVVRHGKTRFDQLRSTVYALGGAGVPVLGTVLNQAPPERGGYYYQYPAKANPDRVPTQTMAAVR